MYCLNNVHKKLNTSNKNFSVGCYNYYNTYNEHIKYLTFIIFGEGQSPP